LQPHDYPFGTESLLITAKHQNGLDRCLKSSGNTNGLLEDDLPDAAPTLAGADSIVPAALPDSKTFFLVSVQEGKVCYT
jgi:hypothetical protein